MKRLDALLNQQEFCRVDWRHPQMSEVQSRRRGHEPNTGHATTWTPLCALWGKMGWAFVGRPHSIDWAEETIRPACSTRVPWEGTSLG